MLSQRQKSLIAMQREEEDSGGNKGLKKLKIGITPGDCIEFLEDNKKGYVYKIDTESWGMVYIDMGEHGRSTILSPTEVEKLFNANQIRIEKTGLPYEGQFNHSKDLVKEILARLKAEEEARNKL